MQHGEVDAFARFLRQRAHERPRHGAEAEGALGAVADVEKTEAVGIFQRVRVLIDVAEVAERGEQAVDGAAVKAERGADLGDAEFAPLLQDLDDRERPLDRLDVFKSSCCWHGSLSLTLKCKKLILFAFLTNHIMKI